MKKSLLALAVLGAFAGAASAQSSVTLFGILDMSLANVQNKDNAGHSVSTQQMRTDGINSSRLGFRGVEDLGGGLKASFWLEAGLSPDIGTMGGSNGGSNPAGGTGAATIFNRRSTASLLGGFGEVRLGRDYNPSFWNTTIFDPFGTNGVGSALNVISTLGSGATTLVRTNNSIGYFLPSNIGGVYGQAMIAAGEGVLGNKYQGGRIGWAGGPIDVAVAYGQTLGSNNVDKYKLFDVGGAWSFNSMFKLTGQFIQAKYQTRKQTTWQLGGIVTLGQGEIHVAYTDANMNGTSSTVGFTANDDSKQFAVGYVYNLSKRTALYTTYSRVTNDGSAAFAVGGPGSALGGSSTGFEAGLRHSF